MDAILVTIVVGGGGGCYKKIDVNRKLLKTTLI
jgi:hypothetical protein